MPQNNQKFSGILDAALPVLVRYGFRKTTMADIAQAAGISRASLYLAFSSKEQLFRAGAARAHADAMDNVIKALAGQGDVLTRIEAAMMTFQRSLIAPFGSSAEMADLFDAGRSLAEDIILGTRAQLLEQLGMSLSKAERNGEIDLARIGARPDDVAGMIVAAMDGIKHIQGAGAALEDGMHLFTRILRTALTPADSGLS